jgi:hypothetical protein
MGSLPLKAVGPFAICLISDRMRTDEPRGLSVRKPVRGLLPVGERALDSIPVGVR